MTKLRQRMWEDMRIRNLSLTTQKWGVDKFAQIFFIILYHQSLPKDHLRRVS